MSINEHKIVIFSDAYMEVRGRAQGSVLALTLFETGSLIQNYHVSFSKGFKFTSFIRLNSRESLLNFSYKPFQRIPSMGLTVLTSQKSWKMR